MKLIKRLIKRADIEDTEERNLDEEYLDLNDKYNVPYSTDEIVNCLSYGGDYLGGDWGELDECIDKEQVDFRLEVAEDESGGWCYLDWDKIVLTDSAVIQFDELLECRKPEYGESEEQTERRAKLLTFLSEHQDIYNFYAEEAKKRLLGYIDILLDPKVDGRLYDSIYDDLVYEANEDDQEYDRDD